MTIPVFDPLGASADPGMPFLGAATDPKDVEANLATLFSGSYRFRRLLEIRVVRHKPGRRCLIEYDVELQGADRKTERATFVGKARARRTPEDEDGLLRLLRARGFGDDAVDGSRVPEPIGVIRRYRMSVQRKVPGLSASIFFREERDPALARAIAAAVCKLHRAGILPRRSHSVADEIAILREKLGELAAERPGWSRRLARLVERCERLGARLPAPAPRGIHRDFYADQVLVDGSRLYLVDFDLFCQGDPAVDAGNFLGHLTEQSLRVLGDPGALSECEAEFEEQFVELSGASTRAAVSAYATFTIARHVYLSTRFEERLSCTEPLLEIAEERLGGGAWPVSRLGVS